MPRSVSVPDIFHKGTAPRGLAPSAPTISGALSPFDQLHLCPGISVQWVSDTRDIVSF